MKERLTVENFGPIKKIDLEIKRFMVLIGAQAAGKSTIAKLLAIFRNIEVYTKDNFSSEDQNRYFQNYNMSEYFQNEKTKLSYSNNNYSVVYENKTWKIIKTELFEIKLNKEKERVTNIIKGVVESNDRLKSANEKEKEETFKRIYDFNWKNLFEVNNEQIYIPADRILVSIIKDTSFSFRGVALPGCLQEFGTKFEFATNRIKDFNIDFLGIRYVNEENVGHRIYFDDNNSISLADSASGIQALLPLQLVVEYISNHTKNNTTDHTFIVEEPELNLFPSTQEAIINYLVKKYNSNLKVSGDTTNNTGKNDLIITTHSPYVLSIINNLLLAQDIASKQPTLADNIEKIIPKDFWISSNDFNAYSIGKGEAIRIFDTETQLIDANYLDEISLDISGKRDELMDLYMSI